MEVSRRGCGNLTGTVGQSGASFFMQSAGCWSQGSVFLRFWGSMSAAETSSKEEGCETAIAHCSANPKFHLGQQQRQSLYKEGESGAAAAVCRTGNCCQWGCGAGRNKNLMSPAVVTSPLPRALVSLKKVTNTPERRGVVIFVMVYH